MEEKTHCKWYNDEFCTNGESPCVADYCPVVEYPELCKCREEGSEKEKTKRKKILANRIYSDATLKKWKKEDLIEEIRILEHNWAAAEEALNNSAKNSDKIFAEQNAEIERLTEDRNQLGLCNKGLQDGINEYQADNAELGRKNAELQKQVDELTADLEKAYETERANIQAEIAEAGTSCHWCKQQIEKDTAKEIIKWIKLNGLLQYGGYVIHDSTLEQIGKKYGVEVE